MQRKIMRGQWLVGGLLLMLFLSGCFQSSGDQLQPTAVISIATWTLIPSSTPPEQDPIIMVVTSTTDPDAIAQDVPDTGGAELNPVPSDNADTLAQFSTATQPAIALDEDQQRATAIIQGSTATAAFAMTATQQALFGGQPFMTATPTLDPTVAGATSAPVLSGADCIDEVRAGDNLFRIALRYGLTVGDIASRNGITNVDLIFPGQMLTIPGCGTTGYRPLPTTIPTTSPVTTTTGGTTGGTTTGGGIFITFTPAPGVPSTTTTGGGTGTCGTHVVTEGETLFQIAQANGSTVSAIASANGIVNVDLIDMGMSLNVPC